MNEDKGEKIVLKTVIRTRKIFVLGEKTECTDARGACSSFLLRFSSTPRSAISPTLLVCIEVALVLGTLPMACSSADGSGSEPPCSSVIFSSGVLSMLSTAWILEIAEN